MTKAIIEILTNPVYFWSIIIAIFFVCIIVWCISYEIRRRCLSTDNRCYIDMEGQPEPSCDFCCAGDGFYPYF